MPYGNRVLVDYFLNIMNAQMHKLPMWKGKEKGFTWMRGALRLLPFGMYEYVFPREDLDFVLNTLSRNSGQYELGNLKMSMLRKIVHAKPIPKFKKDKKFLWYDELTEETINILLIGIREDVEQKEPEDKPYACWTHEAI